MYLESLSACPSVCADKRPGHSLGLDAEPPSVTADTTNWWSARDRCCCYSKRQNLYTALLLTSSRFLNSVCVFVWVGLCLVRRYGNNHRPVFFPWILGILPDVPWRLSRVESVTNVAKHWAFCPDFALLYTPPQLPHTSPTKSVDRNRRVHSPVRGKL